MSYLDLLTDDIMIKILDTRCNDIEKQINKLENDIGIINDDFDIYEPDLDGGKIHLRFADKLVYENKINPNEIFNSFHIGKVIIQTFYHPITNYNTDFDYYRSNIIINPNFFIYMKIAYNNMKRMLHWGDDDTFFEVERPKFLYVVDDITYFYQRIIDIEEKDYEAQLEIIRNDYAVADPYDEDEINQYYQDEIYLNNLSSNI